MSTLRVTVLKGTPEFATSQKQRRHVSLCALDDALLARNSREIADFAEQREMVV
jgi:hypothetical protein